MKRAAEVGGVLVAAKVKAKPGHDLALRQRARNRCFAKFTPGGARFRVLKYQLGYCKVRGGPLPVSPWLSNNRRGRRARKICSRFHF